MKPPASEDRPFMDQDARQDFRTDNRDRDESRDLAYDVIGSAIEVHNYLGAGLAEDLYRNALERELSLRRLSFEPRAELTVMFKGREVGRFRADLLVDDRIVVLVRCTGDPAVHRLEAQSYLKASRRALAIVLNFNAERLQFDRVSLSPRLTGEQPRRLREEETEPARDPREPA